MAVVAIIIITIAYVTQSVPSVKVLLCCGPCLACCNLLFSIHWTLIWASWTVVVSSHDYTDVVSFLYIYI